MGNFYKGLDFEKGLKSLFYNADLSKHVQEGIAVPSSKILNLHLGIESY